MSTLRTALQTLLGECNWEREGHSPGTRAALAALAALAAPAADAGPLLVLELIDQGLSETLAQACVASILERFTVEVRS